MKKGTGLSLCAFFHGRCPAEQPASHERTAILTHASMAAPAMRAQTAPGSSGAAQCPAPDHALVHCWSIAGAGHGLAACPGLISPDFPGRGAVYNGVSIIFTCRNIRDSAVRVHSKLQMPDHGVHVPLQQLQGEEGVCHTAPDRLPMVPS